MADTLISYLEQLGALNTEDRELILSHFEHKSFKQQDFLFTGGKVCDQLFFISKGVARTFAIDENNVEMTNAFIKENQFCTIMYSFNNNAYANENIQASTDIEVFSISKTSLLELSTKLPQIKEMIDKALQQQLIEGIKTISVYSGKSTEEKRKLFMTQQTDIVTRIPANHIASYIGVPVETLNLIEKIEKTVVVEADSKPGLFARLKKLFS